MWFDFGLAGMFILPVVLLQGMGEHRSRPGDGSPFLLVPLIIIFSTRLADVGVPFSANVARLVQGIAFAFALFALRDRRFSAEACVWSMIRGLLSLLTALLINLRPYLDFPSIKKGAPFTNLNNDLAIYIMSADNFIQRGFAEEGRVISYLTGARAKFEVSGAASVIGWVARLSGLSVWRVSNAVMLVVVALTILLVDRFLRFFVANRYLSLLASCVGVVLPYARAAQFNYFLSQAISRMLLVTMLVGVAQLFNSESASGSRRGWALAIAAATASFISYPVGTVSSLAIVGSLVISLAWAATCSGQFQWRPVLLSALAPLVGVGLLVGRWNVVWSNVLVYSRPNATGWTSQTFGIYWWTGLLRGVNSPTGRSLAIALLVGLITLAAASMRRRLQSTSQSSLGLFVMLQVGMSIALLCAIGSDTYQSWKFVSVVQPVLIPLIIVLIHNSLLNLSGRVATPTKVAFASGLVALLAMNLWGAFRDWAGQVQVPDTQLVAIGRQGAIKSVQPLYIALDPYLETMIAPVLLDIHQAFYASPTYLGPGAPVGERCTLTRLRPDSTYHSLGHGFFLGPAEKC